MSVDENSLSHTKWDCKYHIVFSPKFRRKVIYGKLKADIGQILRELCERKEVEIIEANACVDHIHMLVRIPPKISVSSFVGCLKGKSTLMIFERYANLKHRYGNRNFWCKGYYVSTVGANKEAIQRYIKFQQDEDMATDKMTAKEYVDPFRKGNICGWQSLPCAFRRCRYQALIGLQAKPCLEDGVAYCKPPFANSSNISAAAIIILSQPASLVRYFCLR